VSGNISGLRVGSPARFEDRWSGTITALEITEDWEVVNVVVETGFLFWRNSIRLPLSAASGWDDDHVAFSCTTTQAFSHQVPPVAVPSRPVSADTPLSAPGASFAGALVSRSDRKLIEIILSRGVSGLVHVGAGNTHFEGKTLTLAVQPDGLPRYRPDPAVLLDVHRAVREDTGLTADDKRGLHFSVSGGVVTMSGNVRVPHAKERAQWLVSQVPGVMSVRDQAIDDILLETAIGLALDKAGITRHSEVFARASLGVLQLYGYVSSPAAADDAVRAAGAIPGVREVVNRLEVRAAA